MSVKENYPLRYLESLTDYTLVQCRHFNQNSDKWILKEHVHEFIELIYFINGEAQVRTPTGNANLTLYDILVHPATVKHREFVDLHKRQEIFNIGIIASAGIPIDESSVLKDNTGNIRQVIRMLYYHYNNSDFMHKEIEDELVRLLFTYLRKSAYEQPCSEYNIIDRVVEYVQENYASSLSVKELADYVHVSESYLSRLMSAHMGMPPMKYVNAVRIENAKHALKTDMPIVQIASSLGFDEPKYFSTVFKRETGKTPSEYRREIS